MSPEVAGAATLGGFERRASGAAFALAEAGAPRAALPGGGAGPSSARARAVRGRTTGGDGASRSRSAWAAAEAPEGAPESLQASGPPRSDRAPQAASSVRLSNRVPAGPLPEAGYVFQSLSDGGMEPRDKHMCALDWAPGPTDRSIRPRSLAPGRCPGRCTQHALVPKSGLGRVCKSFGRVFQRKEDAASPGAPGLLTHLQEPEGGRSPSRPCPRESTDFPYTPDGSGAARFFGPFPPSAGGGRIAQSGRLQERAPRRQTALSDQRAPLLACTVATLPGARRRFSYIRAGTSLRMVRESFSKKGGWRLPRRS